MLVLGINSDKGIWMKKTNYKNIDFSKKIQLPEIDYPKKFVPALTRLNDYILQGMVNNPSSLENGKIPLGKLPPELDLRHSFFGFVADTNIVIGNLNLVLSDFYDLKENPIFFSGDSKDRTYLLMRTFFYEFFRVKEIFFSFLKELLRLGFFERSNLKSIREGFAKFFENAITIRNKLVHHSLEWDGEEHALLIISTACKKFGRISIDKASGKELTIKDALEKFYNKWVRLLVFEGNRMVIYVQNLVDTSAKITSKKEKDKKGVQLRISFDTIHKNFT